MTQTGKERIAKVIARAGLCSRRDAERWIADGRIQVNGQTLDSPAFTVTLEDKILVDGKPLPKSEKTRLFLYHKPAGLICTARDEKQRPTIFDRLPSELPRVISVGRLDLNTEGLLLLTNDGEFARYLELPATGWRRCYRTRVHGDVSPQKLENLKRGISIDGIRYKPIEATLETEKKGADSANHWLSVILTEGKNREVRKVMEALGLKVNRLIRVSYGPFQLGNLQKGTVKEVPYKILRDQAASFFAKKYI